MQYNPPTELPPPQTQYIKPSLQIATYDAEGLFMLLASHDQEHTFDPLVEIREQNVFEEPEKDGEGFVVD
jgi:hypothetical protein